MSQHSIEITYKDKPATVLVGWDHPLQRFYLVVDYDDDGSTDGSDNEDDDCGEDVYIYTNLYDEVLDREPHHYQDLGYFKKILENLGIQIPDQIWEKVKQDKIANK